MVDVKAEVDARLQVVYNLFYEVDVELNKEAAFAIDALISDADEANDAEDRDLAEEVSSKCLEVAEGDCQPVIKSVASILSYLMAVIQNIEAEHEVEKAMIPDALEKIDEELKKLKKLVR